MTAAVLAQLWPFALAAIPMALLVAAAGRCLPCRPSTRHLLWLALLVLMLVAPFLPAAPVPDLAALGPAPATDAPNANNATDATALPDEPVPAAPPRPIPAAPFATAPVPPDDAVTNDLPTTASPARTRPDELPARAVHRAKPATLPSRPAPLPSAPPAGTDGLDVIDTDAAASARTDAGDTPGPLARALPTTATATTTATRTVPAETAAPAITVSTEVAHLGPALARSAAVWTTSRSRRTIVGWTTDTAAALRGARDAILSIPPLPAVVWAGGAFLVATLTTGRVWRFRRLLETATPASRDTVRRVAAAAAALGLDDAPQVVMVEARVSPLVWCGSTPRLVLPTGLWRQLDGGARDAVIHHELAHLRRRDHWVGWIAMAAAVVYWWHPVVWWIQRRLREEADLCCDAWVTSLLPAARRAYATALLETKRYTSIEPPAVAAVGLGATTYRTRRFARRITMVMTQQNTPRLTTGGLALAAGVAIGCWLITPTLACPPEKVANAPTPPPLRAPLAIAPPAAPAPFAAPRPDEGTFERFMRLRDGETDDMSVEERIKRLEQQLDRLIQHLDQRDARPTSMAPGLFDAADSHARARAAAGGRGTAPAIATRATDPSGAWAVALAGPDCACIGGPAACDCEEIHHTYVIDEGRLEALIGFMSRSDVPVLISPEPNGIEVIGSPAQHRVFAAFVRMIDPDHAKKNAGPAAAGLRGAIGFGGNAVAPPAARDVAGLRGRLEELAAFEAAMAGVHEQMAHGAHEARLLYRNAKEFEKLAEQLEAKAEALEREAEEMRGDEKRAAKARAKELHREARDHWREAERAEERGDAMEDASDETADRAEELAERIEELRELLDELRAGGVR